MSGPVVVVGGSLTPEGVAGLALQGRMVIYPLDFSRPVAENSTRVIRAIRLAGANAVIILTNLDSTAFKARLPRTDPERSGAEVERQIPPVVEVADWAVAATLRAAKVDPAAVRNSPTPVYREVPALSARVSIVDMVLSASTAPNTVGILRGKRSHVSGTNISSFRRTWITSGSRPARPDSINNGADDDGSGTAGVIELAEAFSQPGARPGRSIIFLTVSGEEKGLWGSRYFSEHPAVPLDKVVADINIDMIGRNWPDTIVAIGKEHSDLGATLDRVNAAHRELGMTAIDDQWPDERFYFRSDHYNFARKGVPILFFFNGVHPDYHQVTRFSRQDQQRKGVADPPTALLPRPGHRQRARAAGVEARELQGDRGGGGMNGPPTRQAPSAPKPRKCSAWSHRWCSAATTASRTMSSGATRKESPARNSWRSSRWDWWWEGASSSRTCAGP